MKKLCVILFLCLVSSSLLAQYEHSSKSWNIQLGAGAQKRGNLLFFGGEKFLTNKSSISVNGYWASRNSRVDILPRPTIMNYVAAVNYNYYLFNFNNVIYPYISVGGFVGAEDPDDILKQDFNYKSRTIYGIQSNIGSEFAFSTLALFIAVTPLYEMQNKDFYLIGQIGVKLYIK